MGKDNTRQDVNSADATKPATGRDSAAGGRGAEGHGPWEEPLNPAGAAPLAKSMRAGSSIGRGDSGRGCSCHRHKLISQEGLPPTGGCCPGLRCPRRLQENGILLTSPHASRLPGQRLPLDGAVPGPGEWYSVQARRWSADGIPLDARTRVG